MDPKAPVLDFSLDTNASAGARGGSLESVDVAAVGFELEETPLEVVVLNGAREGGHALSVPDPPA